MPRLPTILLTLLLALLPSTHANEIDDDFLRVTCNSAVKLTHVPSGFKLHSHQVTYGSGSGQQSVTGFQGSDDPNSYWSVIGGYEEQCKRGMPIACGSIIRLRHLSTKKYLHSHSNHLSPLSQNQEVSAYEGEDTGDDWKVTCEPGEKYWVREKPVRFMHDTQRYLTALTGYKYRHPIPGQLEVSGTKKLDKDSQWTAQEGIYIADITVTD